MRRLAVALLLLALPREARAHSSCREQSDITGDRVCSRFGDLWSRERSFPLTLGVGLTSSHLVPSSRNWSGTLGKDNPVRFRLPGQALGMRSIDDVGFDFRMSGYVNHTLYVGIDWGVAFGSVHPTFAQPSNVEIRNKKGINFVHAKVASVIGARLPLGPFSARIEALIGLQVAGVTVEGRKPNGEWVQGSLSNVAFLLEPRVAVDLWTGPWTTMTVWGGGNVFFPADRSMGVSFALHGRAFDGRYL